MAKVRNSIPVTIRQRLYTHIPFLDFFPFRQPSYRQDPRPYYRRHQLLKGRSAECVTTLIPGFFTICAVVEIIFSKTVHSLALDQPAADDLLHVVYPGVPSGASFKQRQTTAKNLPTLNGVCSRGFVRNRIIQSFFRRTGNDGCRLHQLDGDEHPGSLYRRSKCLNDRVRFRHRYLLGNRHFRPVFYRYCPFILIRFPRYPDRIRLLYFDVSELIMNLSNFLQPDHHQYRRSRTYF